MALAVNWNFSQMKLQANQFQDLCVLIVGDVMLDRYWFGSVDRISPEAPVPVLAVSKKESRAGGAANVANNIAALGAKAQLLSVVGDDDTAHELETLVKNFGAEVFFNKDRSIQTTEKLRMIAQNQQLLRADFEKKPTDEVLVQCLDNYRNKLSEADVVILSDYGKGGLEHVSEMISLAKAANTPVVVDPKGSDFSRYRGASLITPNSKEFTAVVGEVQQESEFEEKAIALRDQLGLDSILVTRSEQGMSLFVEGKHIHSTAKTREVFDVSGAGDTVIATIALGLVSDMNYAERLAFANAAAGVVVGKVGTATATVEEISTRLADMPA